MVFHTIRIAPPRQKIYQRLGYHRQVTQISPQRQALTDHHIDEALSLIHLQGVAQRVPIVDRQKGVIILETQVRLESENLAVFLRDCDEALVMGATAGEEIMAAIRHDLATEAITRAVVFDATASEMADGALDWLMDYTRQTLIREGKFLMTRRYSAGYGDFSLENQQLFQALLDLREIGVRITEQSILVPEKSVTALTGIRRAGAGNDKNQAF
jgi:cobalamin-dependent methionine synthase I